MAVYTVHEPPRRSDDALAHAERFAFVRDGFYWAAFLFGPLWIAWRRLWLALLLYVVAVGAIGAALNLARAPDDVQFLVFLLVALLLGFEAGSLVRWTLRRRRWKNVGVVIADRLEAAERRFFDQWVEVPPQSAPPAAPAGPWAARTPGERGDVIGLFPQPDARP